MQGDTSKISKKRPPLSNVEKVIDRENRVFLNSCLDKTHIKNLVWWFLNQYGEKRTITLLESLKYIGFQKATEAGISLGLDDLEIPPEKKILITEALISTQKIQRDSASGSLTSVEKSQCLIDTWNQTSDLLRQHAIQHFRIQNPLNPVYMMAFSGARGNISQVRQLVAMRGLMADPQGAILEFPIQSNFREGLTLTEYLISCYGARKGLVDTALRTATSGYLTRRLVDSAQHAVISMIDCGTDRSILLDGKNLENRLIGRVLSTHVVHENHAPFARNHIISKNDAKIISKHHRQVFIRSPLTCDATTSVCQFCYGSHLASGKLVQIGEAVGVIAAQSIGEPGTQLTMRTFHTGGVGVFSDQALKPIVATSKGKVIFSDPIPGHFIRTPHGKIVYMVKYLPTDPDRILLKIEPCELVHQCFVLREQDLPAGSLLFVKNGECVTPKQIIAQASHLKLTKQKLPESSHPVYSSIAGQVFFESMTMWFKKGSNSGLPDILRMSKIGRFWIFAGFNQHEIRTTSCFVEPGDLVSRNTILLNYKFYSPFRTQIHTMKSKLVFGMDIIQIAIQKISFRKNIYKIKTGNQETVFYKKCRNKTAYIFWSLIKTSTQRRPPKLVYSHIPYLYNNLIVPVRRKLQQISRPFPKGSIFTRKDFNRDSYEFKTPYNSPQVQKSKKIEKYLFPKFLHNKNTLVPHTKFLLTVLKNASSTGILSRAQFQFDSISSLQNHHWVSLGKKSYSGKAYQSAKPQFYPTGLCLENVCIPKQNISYQTCTNFDFVKYKLVTNETHSVKSQWYELGVLLNINISIKEKKQRLLRKYSVTKPLNTAHFGARKNLSLGLIWYGNSAKALRLRQTRNRYVAPSNLLLIRPTTEHPFPTPLSMKKRKFALTGKLPIQKTQNGLFCKQKSTREELIQPVQRFDFKYNSIVSGWVPFSKLLGYKFVSKNNRDPSNTYSHYKTLSNTFSRGLSIFEYTFVTFKDINNFYFRTYTNNWILPFEAFSSGNLKVQTEGEFRYKIAKTTGTSTTVLREVDLITLKSRSFPQRSNMPDARNEITSSQMGHVVRMNQEIFDGVASTYTGQIVKKSSQSITLRIGTPVLASARGIVHVMQDDLVRKNELLITLKSRRLQTEDIVQGIPKIEQLFEARENQAGEVLADTVHIRLQNAFIRELDYVASLKSRDWSAAVEPSLLEAQKFLVDNIIEAYANQGVKIAEKHVEVIVRQMTSRVRVLNGGQTGLLPGELVQYHWIRKFNKQIQDRGLRAADYEPLVLGISKSVLQSESFLLAASFQEVSRVLVRSALSKKRDFLRGLHENVIVGQFVPAGTGLISQFSTNYPQTDNLVSTKNMGNSRIVRLYKSHSSLKKE